MRQQTHTSVTLLALLCSLVLTNCSDNSVVNDGVDGEAGTGSGSVGGGALDEGGAPSDDVEVGSSSDLSCPALGTNLVRNADFSLPAPWLRPKRSEFSERLGEVNDHTSVLGNPAPSALLAAVGGTGGLRTAGHQCLLASPTCLSRVAASIDVKEGVFGDLESGYRCVFRIAGYAAANCTGQASAFVDLATGDRKTSRTAWLALSGSGAIPADVQASASADIQLFCTGPNAFFGTPVIIDNPSLTVSP